MTRGDFVKGYLERRRNTIQKQDRVREATEYVRDCATSQWDKARDAYGLAQNDLTATLVEEADFLFDRLEELRGTLVLPSRSAPDASGMVSGGNPPDGREPLEHSRL